MCVLGSTPIVRRCPDCEHVFARVVGTTPGNTLMSCQQCGNYFNLNSEIRVKESKRQKRLKNFRPAFAH